jgi:SOS-response transcriptional repressor LexA
MEDNPVYDRIKERLKLLNLSERAASIQASGNAELLRNIRRGRSISPRSGSLSKLAKVLGVSESWLLGSTDDVGAPPTGQLHGVRFGGIVEAGAFRRVNGFDQDSEYRLIPLPPDPRYPAHLQYAFEVVGDSMNAAHILPGMWVTAVSLHAWEKIHGEPGDGRVVIVAKTRNGDDERELTVKRLRLFRDRIELQPESSNKTHQSLIFHPTPADSDQHSVAILAVVLTASWIL